MRQAVSSILVTAGLVQNPKVKKAVAVSNERSEDICKRLDDLEGQIRKDC